MMNPPLATVALSVYNLEDWVEDSIQSVVNQSYPHWELIIIDDASTDGTFEILKRYESPNIRVFRNSVNRGTYWNRNLALLYARGEFFTTIDGDDEFYPDKLKLQIEKMGNQDACMCHCIRQHPRFEGGKRIYVSHNTLLFRRRLVEEIGYYDTVRFSADTEYIRRISLKRPILRLLDVLVKYRVREGSLTEQKNSGMFPGSEGKKIREQYEQNYRTWYQKTPQPFLNFPAVRRSFKAGDPIQIVTRDPITVSLATFPQREESLRKTITSILPWADHINVFLNDYQHVPDWLDQEKINIHIKEENVGERSRFYWAGTLQGYHFICDDATLYPETYAQLLLSKIEYYQCKAIVGIRNSLLCSAANDSGASVSPNGDKPEDREVDFLDTGAIAFHTDTIKLSLDLFPENEQTDIALGQHAKKEGIPLILCHFNGSLNQDIMAVQNDSKPERVCKNKSRSLKA